MSVRVQNAAHVVYGNIYHGIFLVQSGITRVVAIVTRVVTGGIIISITLLTV